MSKPDLDYYAGPSGRAGEYARVRCPECRRRFYIYGSEWRGERPIECPSCDYEETHDMSRDHP